MTDPTLPHLVCHIHRQACQHCGRVHTYSHIYRNVTVGRMKSLQPLTSIADAMGAEIVPIMMPVRPIPACHECITTLPVTDAEAHTRWADTLKRKTGATSSSPVTRPSSGQSIDDLD